MARYVVRRLLGLPLMLVAMSLVLFLLLYVRPGNAALDVSGGFNDPATQKGFEHALGLDRPWYVQYADWLGHALRGDLGRSLKPPRPTVASEIRQRIGNTLEIAVVTVCFSTIIGIVVGTVTAVRRNSWLDYVFRIGSIVGISVPGFWIATLLLMLPAIWWAWTPLAQTYVPLTANPIKNLSIIIWPALVLSIGSAAYVARILRSSMLDVLFSDYVRTARAKGLAERAVVVRHVLRTSLITLVTVIGLQLGIILGGSVIVEQIFAIPGIGLLTYNGVIQQDYILVLGAVSVYAFLFLVVNLLVDVLYAVIDPRIRYQ